MALSKATRTTELSCGGQGVSDHEDREDDEGEGLRSPWGTQLEKAPVQPAQVKHIQMKLLCVLCQVGKMKKIN